VPTAIPPALPPRHELRAQRILLRHWRDEDLAAFAALNADPRVMAHFPATQSRADSDASAARVRQRLDARGWGLWALQTPELAFAGFVGLSPVPFELPDLPWPTADAAPPLHEIGWRLARAAWGRGDATAAARRVLAFARYTIALPGVVSFTALSNRRSQAVMQRIGLNRVGEFDHPLLPSDSPLRRHVLYASAWAGPG